MATEQPGFSDGSCSAAADLSAQQYRAVKLVGARSLNLATVAGAPIYGILQDTPTINQPANVMIMGITKALAGAAVAAGVRVMADATARVITAATTGSTCIGWSQEAAAAAGNVFTILLFPSGIV